MYLQKISCKNTSTIVSYIDLKRSFTKENSVQKIEIKDGWYGLWYRINAGGHNAWEIFLNLVNRYSEKHRYYHAFPHVMHVLKELEEFKHACADVNDIEIGNNMSVEWFYSKRNMDSKDYMKQHNFALQEVEMALWYHDAVYDPSASDNEEKSAKLAAIMLRQAGLSSSFIRNVSNLILLTKDHKTTPQDTYGALIVDIELSIFGQSDLVFDRYERGIWKEYVQEGIMSENLFVRTRVEVIEKFLDRKFIYRTPYFRAKYGSAAKKNLKRSLRQLKAKIDPVLVASTGLV